MSRHVSFIFALMLAAVTSCDIVIGYDELEPTATGGADAQGGSAGMGGVAASYVLGGTVTGLVGEVTLASGGAELPLSADGSFSFPTPLVDGTPYAVSVIAQPSAQYCGLQNEDGIIDGTDVSDVFVRCLRSMPTYVKASNSDAGDLFGSSAALSADTFVIGAPGEQSAVVGDQSDNAGNNNGAAYVFVRDGVDWTQQAYLKASNTENPDQFGISVAISGDTIVVGASREASSTTGINGIETDNSASNAGAAYVFVRSGTTWTQQAYLKASNTGAEDRFGRTVAVFGDIIVVGAPSEDSAAQDVNGNELNNSATDAGAAYVFERTGSTWEQQAYLKASNAEMGDNFGLGLAIDGDTVVVGANAESSSETGVGGDRDDNGAASSGAVYVFERNGQMWAQQAYIKATNADAADEFGHSVALRTDTLVVGARMESSDATGVGGIGDNDLLPQSGAAYVYVRDSGGWSFDAFLKAESPDESDLFGIDVAISDDAIVIGASQESSAAVGVGGDADHNAAEKSGAAYLFTRVGDEWSQLAYLKASNTNVNDYFGWAVAVSPDVLLVSAVSEDSNADGIGGGENNNTANASGAVYLFDY